jgi:hypothetical protein
MRRRPFAEARAKLHDRAVDRLVKSLNHRVLLLVELACQISMLHE